MVRMRSTWGRKSPGSSPNMSTLALHAKIPAPESASSSRNSGTGGKSSFSICRLIIHVAMPDIPGSEPTTVGICSPGLPTVARSEEHTSELSHITISYAVFCLKKKKKKKVRICKTKKKKNNKTNKSTKVYK